MVTVIIGGSGSGKSEYAENLAIQDKKENSLYYIATMIPYGEEGKKRLERHHALRKGKNFTTIECYTNLKQIEVPKNATVLLECLSNLTANEMFEANGAHSNTVKEVLKGIENLACQAENLFIVTNDVFCDGVEYQAEMETYLEYLGEINLAISRRADLVLEIVCGIPISLK